MENLYERLISRTTGFLSRTARRLPVTTLLGDNPPISGERTDFGFPPFVTISRDPGSGGRPIGQLVASKLKFAFYDEDIINDIAKSSKLRKSVLQEIDEKGRGIVTDFIHGLLNPDYVSESTFFRTLCKVILTMAYKGRVVILGRGSNFITPNASGLHVRITAPYRVRVQRAITYEGVNERKAKEIISQVESDRAEFVRQYFGKRINDPKYYDLVLNTTFFDMEQGADLVVRAFKMKFPNRLSLLSR